MGPKHFLKNNHKKQKGYYGLGSAYFVEIENFLLKVLVNKDKS